MKIKFDMHERAKDVTVIQSIIDDNSYICKSSKSKNEWTVRKENNLLYCDCPDFSKHQPQICKHVTAVMIYEKIPFEVENEIIKEPEEKKGSQKEETKEVEKTVFSFEKKEVLYSFRTALNKGDVLKAWYFLQIMIETSIEGFAFFINEYIQKNIGLDLCVCDPDFIAGLRAYSNYKILDVPMLYALVDIYCNSKKSHECERCSARQDKRLEYRKNIAEDETPIYELEKGG